MKYIDADRLRAEIEKTYKSEIRPWLSGVSATSAIYDYVLPLIASLQQEQPSLPSNLDEAAFAYEDSSEYPPANQEQERMVYDAFKAGAELMISELFEKLKITPLKVIGKDEYGYPVYDYEVGHYYRTFTLFGEKYKCDQTDSGEAGEQMLAGQGVSMIITDETEWADVDKFVHSNCDGASVIQIRKKDGSAR